MLFINSIDGLITLVQRKNAGQTYLAGGLSRWGSSMPESSGIRERKASFESLDKALSALIDGLSDGAPTLALGEALLMEALAIIGAHEGRAMLAERLRIITDEIELEAHAQGRPTARQLR